MNDFAETHLAADFDGQDWEGDWYEQPSDDEWEIENYGWYDSDVDHDAYVLASGGWGTDEDYGFFGDEGYEPPF